MKSTKLGLWISALAAVACGTQAEDEPPAQTSAASSGLTAAGEGTSGTAAGEGSEVETGAGEGNTSGVPPMSTTDSGDDEDSGGGPLFDLGIIPDTPADDSCQQAIDIVFTMDVSTTMSSFIQILSDEILAVDAAIAELDIPEAPHYGLAVFVDDALLVNGGAPYVDATALQADFDMWAAFTASNQQVGGGGSNSTWEENSLDALYFAADEFQWRPAESTIRMVIHVTDDTFWDGPTVGNGVMIQHGYGETVQRLQDQMVRTYAFSDDIGGSCNCDDVTPGWSSPYMGALPIPEATDGSNYPIAEVLGGTVSLSDAITEAVEESFCDIYTPQG
ncbi:MAG: vWA domain-containing protein [Myxococcota bacterium]